MTDTIVPESKCPSCGTKLNDATASEGDHVPSPNDITVCLHCGHVMAFDDTMHLRELTDAEIRELAGHPDILRVQKARAMVMTTFQKGDTVRVTYEGRTVQAVVTLASPNSRSLVIEWTDDRMLGGHISTMPIFRHDDGIFYSLFEGLPVTLEKDC